MLRSRTENCIRNIPVYQYGFLRTEDLHFWSGMRALCRETCPFYGTSWSCPPAVGRLERCKSRCLSYPEVLVFSTLSEEMEGPENRLIRRRDHGHADVTRQVEESLGEAGLAVYILSSSTCSICAECAFPRGNCRHPERMYPCIESAGLVVADIAEACNMDHYLGEEMRLAFSLCFLREEEKKFHDGKNNRRTDHHSGRP